jgi:hypothetical protein
MMQASNLVIQRYVRALWLKLMKALTTPEAMEIFVAELRRLPTIPLGVRNQVHWRPISSRCRIGPVQKTPPN